jgi:hypothetical protein
VVRPHSTHHVVAWPLGATDPLSVAEVRATNEALPVTAPGASAPAATGLAATCAEGAETFPLASTARTT